MSAITSVIKRLNWARLLVGSLLFVLGLILLISSKSFGQIAPDARDSLVDHRLGDGDLTCQMTTSVSGLYRLPPIIYVDVIGGYNSASAATKYFKYALPLMPFSELQQTQANNNQARFEIPGKAVFIVEKNEQGQWQPYVYSFCPDLNWSGGN